MGQLWSVAREKILNSERLTQLLLPHKLNRRHDRLTGSALAAIRLRVVIHLMMAVVFGGSALVQVATVPCGFVILISAAF